MVGRHYLNAIFWLAIAIGLVRAEAPHWSFQKGAMDPTPPKTGSPWAKTPIDSFILAKLDEHQLAPQQEADRHSLIRRVSIGVTGLPPSIDEVEAFTSDPSPKAYEHLVDRLLASPHYGERWGRHWLDVARFGESDGILAVYDDRPRKNAWRYRDSVIRAFNADLPFDHFVSYQLCGPPNDKQADYQDLRQFVHLGTRLQNNENPNDRQFHRLDDMVSTTGSAFLGLTFGCARCHDHPVDPMSTEEYYQFTAIFFDQFQEKPEASAKNVPLEITEPRVLKKGSWTSPGSRVEPGFLKVLMGKPAGHWRRDGVGELTALATWLTDSESGAGMQAARVIVNRLWHHHFGRGLVSTPNDFGALGSAPTHPKLLDWLAIRLVENDWRLKPIHRLILTSAVYRQAASTDGAPLAYDADNQWLWHRCPQRLEAEIVRDSMLRVAGVLREDIYGPSIPIGTYKAPVEDLPASWRRSIYLQAHRTAKHPTLSLFDTPNTERSVGARNNGVTPDGALFALNAPLVWELAERFANRLKHEAGPDPSDQIQRAYHLALCRPPTSEEREIGMNLLRTQGHESLVNYCHLILGLNEFLFIH